MPPITKYDNPVSIPNNIPFISFPIRCTFLHGFLLKLASIAARNAFKIGKLHREIISLESLLYAAANVEESATKENPADVKRLKTMILRSVSLVTAWLPPKMVYSPENETITYLSRSWMPWHGVTGLSNGSRRHGYMHFVDIDLHFCNFNFGNVPGNALNHSNWKLRQTASLFPSCMK